MSRKLLHTILEKHNRPLAIGLLLALFTIVCRFCTGCADFYALHLYPIISATLSWISSPLPFSMQDLAIAGLLGGAVYIIIKGRKRHWRWKQYLRHEGTLLLWTYVWFYMGWCTNYYRSDLYTRVGVQPAAYNEEVFRNYLTEFAGQINKEWTPDTHLSKQVVEQEIKGLYARVPSRYGLAKPRSWQHPKTTFFNRIYSAVGILGFMEPLFAESCLNKDLQDFDFPHVYAHEYAHLLGISSEAECNWWSYQMCTQSAIQAIRYSGYKGIAGHLIQNAQMLLTQEEFEEWIGMLRPEVIEDLQATHEHWRALQLPALRRMHEVTYDSFLKSNQLSSGLQDYSQVIGMILSVKVTLP